MHTIEFIVKNDWSSGFTAELVITNVGDEPLEWSQLALDGAFTITNLWNGSVQPSDSDGYVVTAASWNRFIPAGGSITVGFNASKQAGFSATDVTAQLLGLDASDPVTEPEVPEVPEPIPPTIALGDVVLTEGDSPTATFEVSLSAASDQAIMVSYGTQDGTAIAGADYTATSGTLTFAPGETSKTIAVPVLDDNDDESNETFTLQLSDPSYGELDTATATATVGDNDEPPPPSDPEPSSEPADVTTGETGTTDPAPEPIQPSSSDPVATEGDTTSAGADAPAAPTPQTVTFVVTSEWNSGFNANMTIRNDGDTPINGWELAFHGNFGIAQLWNGSLVESGNGSFTVAPVGWNQSIAPGQSISFGFTGSKWNGADPVPSNYRINGISLEAPAPAPTPEPEPLPLPSLSISDVVVTEGVDDFAADPAAQVGFRVVLAEASSESVTVQYATQDGTAIAGADYTATSGTLTFAPGETEKFIGVAIADDATVESSETFTLELSAAEGATLATNQASGTILDNDMAPPSAGPEPVSEPEPPPVEEPASETTEPATDTGMGNPSTGLFNYGEALQKSFLFIEAQRSGPLTADSRLEWRGDSAVNDGANVGMDLSGGYYDAGDHMKFGFPMAASMTLLSWGVEAYRDAYSAIGQLDEALDAIKWGTDYILKAHVTDASGTQEFWGQVGNPTFDHSYWGAPEDMTMDRPAFKIDRQNPGSDLAGEAAAALAAASIIFRPIDTTYADTLLTNAQQLYDFADTYRGKYSDSIPAAAEYYNSWNGYEDELAWGAIWIHDALEASGVEDGTYLAKAEAAYQRPGAGWTQSWDSKGYGTAIKLAQETGDSSYINDVEDWLDAWTEDSNIVTHTDGGLAWLTQWGSLRYAANTAFLAGIYADTVNDPNGQYDDFATRQINYILGDNPRDFSYMVGFGDNYALNPHHRAASGTTDEDDPAVNEHILFGALVGGPSQPDDFAYQDIRTDYVANEVALDYNAGFTGALARMVHVFGGTALSDTELNALPGVVMPDIG